MAARPWSVRCVTAAACGTWKPINAASTGITAPAPSRRSRPWPSRRAVRRRSRPSTTRWSCGTRPAARRSLTSPRRPGSTRSRLVPGDGSPCWGSATTPRCCSMRARAVSSACSPTRGGCAAWRWTPTPAWRSAVARTAVPGCGTWRAAPSCSAGSTTPTCAWSHWRRTARARSASASTTARWCGTRRRGESSACCRPFARGSRAAQTWTAAAFSADGAQLLTGTTDRRVQLWDLPAVERRAEWEMPRRTDWKRSGAYILAVGFGAAEGACLSVSADGFVHRLRLTP